jgi:hypothetical protein
MHTIDKVWLALNVVAYYVAKDVKCRGFTYYYATWMIHLGLAERETVLYAEYLPIEIRADARHFPVIL